jgi:hypothetical protein
MPDDKSQTGKLDHDHVSATQDYEVEQLMQRHKKTKKQVLDAIKKAGPMRVEIERALRKGH